MCETHLAPVSWFQPSVGVVFDGGVSWCAPQGPRTRNDAKPTIEITIVIGGAVHVHTYFRDIQQEVIFNRVSMKPLNWFEMVEPRLLALRKCSSRIIKPL